MRRKKQQQEEQEEKAEEFKNPETLEDEKAAIERMKQTLLQEYPFLNNRRDLDEMIDNYCTLAIKVKRALMDPIPNSVTVKSMVEAQIKLGQFLGISESERQKTKLLESKDNIASLSVKFQETIENFPELLEEFKVEELKMLLNKFNRGELPRKLFELPDYAGMTVEEALEYVKKVKKK